MIAELERPCRTPVAPSRCQIRGRAGDLQRSPKVRAKKTDRNRANRRRAQRDRDSRGRSVRAYRQGYLTSRGMSDMQEAEEEGEAYF